MPDGPRHGDQPARLPAHRVRGAVDVAAAREAVLAEGGGAIGEIVTTQHVRRPARHVDLPDRSRGQHPRAPGVVGSGVMGRGGSGRSRFGRRGSGRATRSRSWPTSWGGPSVFPHVFERGLDVLRRVFDFEVREMPSARRAARELGADPRARADDLNAAFADPSVRAIVSSIGGVDSVRILPFLDPSLALANPKCCSGSRTPRRSSRSTTMAGLVTFNGPSVMAGFAQIEAFPGAVDHVRSLLFEPAPTFEYRPFAEWVDGYRDWRDPSNAGAVGERRAHDGWRWLQGSGVARRGGCSAAAARCSRC